MQEMFAEDSVYDQQEFPTYSDTLKSDAYVSQFLNISGFTDELSPFKNEPIIHHFSLEESSPAEEKKKLKKKKKSIYHNFQKHLVNTFRKFIEEEMFPKYEHQMLRSCQNKLWQAFCQSKKLNKTLLCITLGDISNSPNKELSEYGFKNLVDEFTLQTVVSIQQKLKQNIIEQLEKKNVRQTIENRRINNKEQFKKYYDSFLSQLKGIRPVQRVLKVEIESNTKGNAKMLGH